MKTRARNELPTVWEVPDPLWQRIVAPVLNEFDPPPVRGRRRADPRRCLNGIIYRARTGCQWNALPQQFGDDATVHRTLQRWEEKGILDKIWALLVYHCEELSAVYWEWQAADGCLNKARFIGKKGDKANRARHRKAEKPTTQGNPSLPLVKALVRTPVIVEKWASNKACLSSKTAGHLLCVSQEQT